MKIVIIIFNFWVHLWCVEPAPDTTDDVPYIVQNPGYQPYSAGRSHWKYFKANKREILTKSTIGMIFKTIRLRVKWEPRLKSKKVTLETFLSHLAVSGNCKIRKRKKSDIRQRWLGIEFRVTSAWTRIWLLFRFIQIIVIIFVFNLFWRIIWMRFSLKTFFYLKKTSDGVFNHIFLF